MNRHEVGLLLFTVCGVIFVLSSIYDYRGTEIDILPTRNNFPISLGFKFNQLTESPRTTAPPTESPDLFDVNKCVPYYDFLSQELNKKTGNRQQPRTPFLLLAAYDYPDHVVVTLQADGWFGTSVYCRYLDDNFEEIGKAVPSSVFAVATVHCCKRKGAKYVSVTLNETQHITQWTALLDRTQPVPKYNLSLCLAPIYGDESKWLLLAETIEHYRIQGVEHFYLYIKDMDTYSRYLVEDYLRSGEIEVVWLEYRKDRPLQEWQLFGVQDCLQRSRFHSKYAIFADLDERITPSKNESLIDIAMEEFSKKNKTGGIRFRPRWILRDKAVPSVYEGAKTLNESLPTLVFHNTSHWPYAGHTAKMILDPTKILIMWVHHVSLAFPGYGTVEIEPERAVIRHYRDIFSGEWGKRWFPETAQFGNYSHTEYPSYLMDELYENVLERLERVYNKKLAVP